MRQRVALAVILGVVVLASSAGVHRITHLSVSPAGGATVQQPNILFIITDDQTVGTVAEAMPNVTRYMVKGGRRYTNFFITDPLCCPSRSAIMTGRLNHNNGVTGNGQSTFHLDMNTTLQHYLHDAGYQTWISGKFLNGWHYTSGSPNPPDFDRFTITPGGRHRHLRFNQDGKFFVDDRYAEPLIERQALRYLAHTEASDQKPWLGYLSFTVPHGPFTPMKGYRSLPMHLRQPTPSERERDISDKWPGYAAHAKYGFNSAEWLAQLRMLRQADDIIGRVFAQLQAQRELRNTIVVFLSDNGFQFRSHELYGKRLPYTESVRVPAAIRWTGHIPADSVDGRLSTNVDLTPTLLKAAKVTPALVQPLDGRDLLDPSWARKYVLLEQWKEPTLRRAAWQPTWASLRSKKWQYIEYYNAAGQTTFREYYNLLRDPWELHSSIAKTQGAGSAWISTLHNRVADARSCIGAACP